jgi:hypothetical protein
LEDWALIRRLAAEGVPKARIAARLGVSRTTVVKAVASDAPPRYERRTAATAFTPFEARVRALLEVDADLPATVIAERVGWTGSITWFRENVKRLRPEHRRIDPADRLAWEAGDAAQCDLWFPPRKIPLEDGTAKLLPVLVITAAHSRFITARMIPTRKTEDLLLGSWELIRQLGRVPRRLIWDNEPGIGRGQRRAEGVAAFMGTLATRLLLLPPRDPESKGIVERRNGWFETSFMPGRAFTSPADFNGQFGGWLARANARIVRTIGAAPMQRLDADRAAMLPLPPLVLHLGWRNRVCLGRVSERPALGPICSEAGFERARVRPGGGRCSATRDIWLREGAERVASHDGSHNGTAGRDLEGGDTTSVQHYEAVAVGGTKGAVVVGEDGDRVFCHLIRVGHVGFLVGDVEILAADKPDA